MSRAEKLPLFGERTLVCFAALYRTLNLVLVQTWFVPDEYWQTLEPAHRLAFGYGYLTWEWHEALRSYSYPCIFAAVYKILTYIGLDNHLFMVNVPKVICCVLAAFADRQLYKLASQLFDQKTACWTMFVYYSNWFQFFCAPRTLLNTVESALVVISSSYLCELSKSRLPGQKKLLLAATLSAWAIVIRPTSILLLVPIWLRYVRLSNIRHYAAATGAGLLVAISTAFVDRICYESWTFPLWNFVQFNLIRGGSAMFGSHAWHWYMTSGIPSVFLFQIVLILSGIWKSEQNRFFCNVSVLYIFVHSLIAHKELRFLLPTVPLLSIYGGYFLANHASAIKTWRKWAFAFLVLPNVVLALFTGLIHQRGVMDVTKFLNKEAQTNHVHAAVPMRFLTCMPEKLSWLGYVDEADNFHKEPMAWFERELSAAGLRPTHIVLYEKMALLLADLLRKEKYSLTKTFFNTYFPQGIRQSNKILLYERIKS
uniref:Mannosyltransferase n=1 Tax=Trichuris muris TaxID=70415 RepID=A0A5S6QVQ5_TRIMR